MPEDPKQPAWRDPFPMDHPLDIRMVATAVAHHFITLLEHAQNRFERDFREAARIGIEIPRGLGPTSPEVREIHDKIVMLLRAYDENRTRHIAFLKDELIRMHETSVRRIPIRINPEQPKP